MKRHCAELIIIPPIAYLTASTNARSTRACIARRIYPISAYSCQSASRVRLPPPRSPGANCPRISVEYIESNRGAIIPGRDTPRKRATSPSPCCRTRVHARAGLFYLDAFPQLARSISHTQITHVPSPPSVPVIYVPVPGCHRSRSPR